MEQFIIRLFGKDYISSIIGAISGLEVITYQLYQSGQLNGKNATGIAAAIFIAGIGKYMKDKLPKTDKDNGTA